MPGFRIQGHWHDFRRCRPAPSPAMMSAHAGPPAMQP
jgi:hypothetical protein